METDWFSYYSVIKKVLFPSLSMKLRSEIVTFLSIGTGLGGGGDGGVGVGGGGGGSGFPLLLLKKTSITGMKPELMELYLTRVIVIHKFLNLLLHVSHSSFGI